MYELLQFYDSQRQEFTLNKNNTNHIVTIVNDRKISGKFYFYDSAKASQK
jgi:hypothetical protein